MSIIVEIFPQCDFCRHTFPDVLSTTKAICRAHMRRDGWKRVRGKDRCPDCVKALEPSGVTEARRQGEDS